MIPKQLTQEFHIPEGTLRYYRHAGIGPAYFRLQGRIRYRRADVEAWINQQEAATRNGRGGE